VLYVPPARVDGVGVGRDAIGFSFFSWRVAMSALRLPFFFEKYWHRKQNKKQKNFVDTPFSTSGSLQMKGINGNIHANVRSGINGGRG
jgi:hypothetical protein